MGVYVALRLVETRVVSRHKGAGQHAGAPDHTGGDGQTEGRRGLAPKAIAREMLMVGLSVCVAVHACRAASVYGSSVEHFGGRLGRLVQSMKGGAPVGGGAQFGGTPVSLGNFPASA